MRKRGAMLGGGARWGTKQCRGEERSWTSTVGSGVVVLSGGRWECKYDQDTWLGEIYGQDLGDGGGGQQRHIPWA